MTRHGVGLTRDEREEPLARAGRGGDGAAETRWVNLLLAVDAEATRACPSTAGMAHDPKERPVGGGIRWCACAQGGRGRARKAMIKSRREARDRGGSLSIHTSYLRI